MKIILNLSKLYLTAFILFFIAISIISCKKTEPTLFNQKSQTIAKQISTNPEFSILNAALIKSGLKVMLDSPGTYTFFAPNNDAFLASGVSSTTINNLAVDQLKAILLYELLPSKFVLNDFKQDVYYNEVSIGGDSSFVIKILDSLYINGIKVAHPDMQQSNGVIHATSKLLKPPYGNMIKSIAADSNLTFYHAAILKTATSGQTNFVKMFDCGCRFTIFAPTNDAFIKSGYTSIEAINASDINKIVAILSTHTIKERFFLSDLMHQNQLQMMNGCLLNIDRFGNGVCVKGFSNKEYINILKSDILTSQGVLHVIGNFIE